MTPGVVLLRLGSESRRRCDPPGSLTMTGDTPKTSGSGVRLLAFRAGHAALGSTTSGKPHARGTAHPKHCPASMSYSSERAP